MPVDIRKPLKKYLPHLLKAKADNLNEADTVQRLIKVFEEVLEPSYACAYAHGSSCDGSFRDVGVLVAAVSCRLPWYPKPTSSSQ